MRNKIVDIDSERINYLNYLLKSGKINRGAMLVCGSPSSFMPELREKAMQLYREARYKELSDLCTDDYVRKNRRARADDLGKRVIIDNKIFLKHRDDYKW